MDGDRRTMWVFEPRVALEVFESWIEENEIQVYRDEWLDRSNGVELTDRKIAAITCLSGKRLREVFFSTVPMKETCWHLQELAIR